MHFPIEGAGTGHYVHNLLSGLARQGHDVGVVYAQSPNCTRRDTPYQRFPVDFEGDGLEFPFPVFESHPLSDGETFGSIDDSKMARYKEEFEKELDNAIETMRPNVVNVHHGWVLGDMLSRKGIPYFVTLHGTELTAFDRYPAYQKTALDGLRGAEGVIALTDDQRQSARDKYGIDDDKFSVITSGIDTNFFSPMLQDRREVLGKDGVSLNSNQPVALYVGRLAEIKGVEYLVDAAVHLKDEAVPPKILVVGDGVLRRQLVGVKEKYKLSDLSFLGLKNSDQIRSLYNSADLVVVPSLSECFPLVPAEAMACGIPFVGTDIPGGLDIQMTGLEKVVRDISRRDVSLRVPVKDSDALALKIIETLGLGLKKTMGRPIRRLSEQFSLTEMIRNTSKLYSGASVA